MYLYLIWRTNVIEGLRPPDFGSWHWIEVILQSQVIMVQAKRFDGPDTGYTFLTLKRNLSYSFLSEAQMMDMAKFN